MTGIRRRPIDLRSDTVTRPTEAMRRAMYKAEVGDDARSEDRTTNLLQEMAAERFGRAKALFVPSGTMANTIAGMVLLRSGDAVVCEERTGVLESGHFSGLRITFRTLVGRRGRISPEQLEPCLGGGGYVGAKARLLVLENTMVLVDGVALPPDYISSVAALAHSAGAAVYLDGARVFNAAIALGVDVQQLCAPVDALMFCLSKGLSAPIGSVLVGSDAFIAEARKVRNVVGGQMRQTGVVAAAGIVALRQMVDRLAVDHARARTLAEAIAEIPGMELDPDGIETNIVWFGVGGLQTTAAEFVNRLASSGVLSFAWPNGKIRMVTHKDVSDADIARAISVIRSCAMSLGVRTARVAG